MPAQSETTSRPWMHSNEWFHEYARRACEIKGITDEREGALSLAAIEGSFRRVYRAVAIDVDGTLTLPNESVIDPEMASVIDDLLLRGVPVLLVTGRGRTSTRMAAEELRAQSRLSDWHFRRLTCLTNNGVWLLHSPGGSRSEFLSEEERLPAIPLLPAELFSEIRTELVSHGFTEVEDGLVKNAREVQIRREELFVRVVFFDAQDLAEVAAPCRGLADKHSTDDAALFFATGTYATHSSLDIVGTNKAKALEHWANEMGLESGRILRIGDQGHEAGNDHLLLQADCGFTVDRASANPQTCHPILDPVSFERVTGAAATRALLKATLLFPPLTLAPTVDPTHTASIRTMHRDATQRARVESRTMDMRFRLRTRALLSESDSFDRERLEFSVDEVFDRYSGGVKLWDWELDRIDPENSAARLLSIPPAEAPVEAPGLEWALFTDSALILRGPRYYFALSAGSDDRTVEAYVNLALEFVRESERALEDLREINVTVEYFKLFLAIQDNIRNILLNLSQLQFAFGAAAEAAGDSNDPYARWRRLYINGVVPHVDRQLIGLFDVHQSWVAIVGEYGRFVRGLLSLLEEEFSSKWVTAAESAIPDDDKFKWRECDHFVQNVAAVQLGLRGRSFQDQTEKAERIVAVGIAYGGQELPAIASEIAKRKGMVVAPALVRMSLYGDQKLSEQIREGTDDYVNRLLVKIPLAIADANIDLEADEICLIMDDNCTTLSTVQIVRDLLVIRGADVVRAVIVRYPGINRLRHMALPKHGFPDPEVLFSFVKGLVAPSPYTRLFAAADGANPYVDEAGVFDKSKKRLHHYIDKNSPSKPVTRNAETNEQ